MEVSGGMGLDTMKKAMQTQEQSVMKILEDSQQQMQQLQQTEQVQQTQQADTAALTGVGGNLNIKV